MWMPRGPTWLGLLLPKRKQAAKRKRATFWEIVDIPAADEGGVVIAIGIVALIALIVVGVPVLVFVFDLAILGILLVLGVIARVLFRRPWIVEAATDGPSSFRRRWPVTRWGASERALDRVAERIRSTGGPPDEALPPTG
jgi:hypothetical protein